MKRRPFIPAGHVSKKLYITEKVSLNIASFHWLLQGKMTPKNRTVPYQWEESRNVTYDLR